MSNIQRRGFLASIVAGVAGLVVLELKASTDRSWWQRKLSEGRTLVVNGNPEKRYYLDSEGRTVCEVSGIINIPAGMRASQVGKEFFSDLERRFPCLSIPVPAGFRRIQRSIKAHLFTGSVEYFIKDREARPDDVYAG